MFTTEAQKTWRQRQLRQALKLRPKLLKLRRSDGKVTCSRLKLNLRPKIKLDKCLQWQGHPLQALVDTMTWRYVWMAKTRIENKTIVARSSWAPGFVCSKPKAKPQVLKRLWWKVVVKTLRKIDGNVNCSRLWLKPLAKTKIVKLESLCGPKAKPQALKTWWQGQLLHSSRTWGQTSSLVKTTWQGHPLQAWVETTMT